MLRAPVAALVLTLSATLAGCTLLQDGDGREGTLVRIVDLSMDPRSLAGDVNDATDVLAALADTRFEYTHEGAERAVEGVTIAYVDEAGRERDEPLSAFTSATTIARGDRLTLTGALLTSPVRIAAGDDLLASRGGAPQPWLEAGGYPLPLAMRGGLAVWDLRGNLDLDAGFDAIQVEEEGVSTDHVCDDEGNCTWAETPYRDTLRLTDGSAVAASQQDGTLRLDSVGTALAPAVELGLDGTWIVSALVDVSVLHERTGAEAQRTQSAFGLDLDASAIGDGSLRLRFDQRSQLQAVGGEGDLDLSGSLTVWDDEHARAEAFSPVAIDGFDLQTPYEEMPVPFGGNPVDFVVRALSDLWRMDLAPGDEFNLDSGDRFGTGLPSTAVAIGVMDGGSKQVPAGTFEALRVETTAVVEVPVEGTAPERFELPTLTTWIDEDSGLPVAVEQSMAYHYDEGDFASVFAAAQSWEHGLAVTPPGDLHVDLEGRTLVELTEWRDGFEMAPMAAVLLPFASFAAPFASFLAAPLYGFGMPMGHAAQQAPDVAFSTDETRDRITLVMAASDLTYGEFQMKASQPLLFERNGAAGPSSTVVGPDYAPLGDDPWQPLVAGDFLDFCVPDGAQAPRVVVDILHAPTNTLVYETMFNGVLAC